MATESAHHDDKAPLLSSPGASLAAVSGPGTYSSINQFGASSDVVVPVNSSSSATAAAETTGAPMPQSNPDALRINVRTLVGQTIPVVLERGRNGTVLEIKKAVENHNGVPPQQMRLIFAGRELTDNQTMGELAVADGYVLHLVLRQNPVTRAAPGGMGGAADLHMPLHAPAGDPQAMMDAWQLGRMVKMFAVIDSVFLLIWSFSAWPLAFAVLLAVAGYYGAHHYRWGYVALYLLYQVISIILRGYFVFTTSKFALILLLAIGILIEAYIMYITVKFFRVLRSMPEGQRLELRAMANPATFNIV